MKERKKWSVIAISLFVLAVVLAVGGRFLLPKPASEVESVVEQYLLMRTGFMACAAGLAFLGLWVMANKLRCPHCGAMALRKIVICGNCGKDPGGIARRAAADRKLCAQARFFGGGYAIIQHMSDGDRLRQRV